MLGPLIGSFSFVISTRRLSLGMFGLLIFEIVCSSVHMGHECRALRVVFVGFHKEFSSFVIQAGFGKGNNQEASNNTQDMRQRRFALPVLFERIDTNGTRLHVHIGMVDFGEKESPRRSCREILRKDQFENKELSFVRSLHRAFNLAEDLFQVSVGQGIIVIGYQSHSFGWRFVQVAKFSSYSGQCSWWQIFRADGVAAAVLTVEGSCRRTHGVLTELRSREFVLFCSVKKYRQSFLSVERKEHAVMTTRRKRLMSDDRLD